MDTVPTPQTFTTKIADKEVPITKSQIVTQEQYQQVIASKKFKDYVSQLQVNLVEFKSIKVLYVYMFGPNVGFVDLEVEAYSTIKKNVRLPGFVFLRGKAVGILVLINKKYMALVKQYRVPAGKWMLEAPAGMIDESGNFVGVAAKQMEEETGLSVQEKELKFLGSYYPSCGGSDEELLLYVLEKTLSEEEMKELTGQIHGHADEGEIIKIQLHEFTDENVAQTQDSQLMVASYLYKAQNK